MWRKCLYRLGGGFRLHELELHKCVWEDKGEKVEEQWSEQKQSQTEIQIQEAKKVAVVNWWRSHCEKGFKACMDQTRLIQELPETEAKLLQAEQTISDMRERACCLQASQTSGKDTSSIRHINEGNSLEKEPAKITVEKVVKVQRYAAVTTEPEEIAASEEEQTQLATISRMEAMVSSALEMAKLVRQSEQRVDQVRQRMESITQGLEEPLGQAANVNEHLNARDVRIREKTPTKVCFCYNFVKKKKIYVFI